jgi:Dolichyl-phosphate-mannose-protein mannosyltransferase
MICRVQAAVTTAGDGRPDLASRWTAASRRLLRASPEARWVWLAVGVFVAVSAWWLAVDSRIPIWDAGYHVSQSYVDGLDFSQGHFGVPLERWDLYPPFLYLIGGVTYLFIGLHPAAMTLVSSVIFVPLMAFGCYGVGALIGGRRAGVLAALFALGTPMFVSMSHEFMIDTPQAALIAVSVWAILASQRFSRPGVSVLAGILCGLAMLTKETSVLFFVGVLGAVVIRGGWRHWRGILLFCVALAIIAAPWYVYQWPNIKAEYTGIGQLYVNSVQSPPRFSLHSIDWYFWNLVNEQIGLPLTIAFAIGTGIAIVHSVRGRFSTESYLPEVVAGGIVGYLGVTYLIHKDPRYSFPALVYVAVLGTFWLPSIRRRALRVAAIAIVVGFAAINFVGMSTGLGGTRRIAISLPGAQDNLIYPGQLTIYQNVGWLRGGPERDGNVPALLKRLRQAGVTEIAMDSRTANAPDFSAEGISPYAAKFGIGVVAAPSATAQSAFLLLHLPKPGDPPPCGRLQSGAGIYIIRGPTTGLNTVTLRDPSDPHQQYLFMCPGRLLYSWPR